MSATKKYKVCAIVGDFENRKKGLTHYIFENIDKNKFDIFYICYPSRDYILWNDLYLKKFNLFGFKTYLIPRYSIFKRISKINNIIKYEKPDMIFSAATQVDPFIIGKFKNLPVVDSVLGLSPSFNFIKLLKFKIKGSGISRLYSFRLQNLCRRIIAISVSVKNNLINNNIIKEKILVIYSGINIDLIKQFSNENFEENNIFNKKNRIVLCVGRLSPEKGNEYLIKAFSLIKNKKNLILIFVGWGPEEERLKKLVKSLHLTHKIYFLGFVNNPYKYMKKSTVFVLSSISDAFPSVLLEAAACGLPVIATNCGGPSEIIERLKNGILINPGDVQSLSSAIISLINDKLLLKQYSDAGLKNIQKFNIKRTADAYANIWLNCINGSR